MERTFTKANLTIDDLKIIYSTHRYIFAPKEVSFAALPRYLDLNYTEEEILDMLCDIFN